ncbi:MAG: glutamine--fructose-6-phosphate transaminase (isomerizing) [Fimbriimonadaceae bacterium]
MCGIAGYIGPRNAVDVAYDQLKRLEYRGYDSAGIAYLNGDEIRIMKRAGKLSELGKLVTETLPETHLAIGHSRWATHGGPTDANAHPHFDQVESVAIIHNGIIENYLDLKEELTKKGRTFQSETDTEVAAQIIGEEYEAGVPLEEAVRRAIHRIRGAYALVVVSKREPNKIVAARNASPLVLGFGENENALASDIPALLPYTRDVAFVEDNQIAVITQDEIRILDRDGKELPIKKLHVEWDIAEAEKGGYDHFMIKEIHEQPEVVRRSLAGRINDAGEISLDNLYKDQVWQEVDRLNIIACGTAYHAGLMGKYLFEKMLRLPTDVFYSSEFRYGDPLLSPRSLAVFVSQSGETADTLAALRLCKERRLRTLGVVNVIGSSIARECDRTLFTQAGPEISVASTKAYMAQVVTLTLLALYVAQVREMPGVRISEHVNALKHFGESVEQALQLEPQIMQLAEKFKNVPLVFFLGRGADAYVSYEAALKLKEIAYVPTQESPAGEMKHGPLALIEEGVLAVFGSTDASMRDKVVSNVREVQARGGTILAVTTEGDDTYDKIGCDVLHIPDTKVEFLNALLSIVPLQMFSYYLAKARGCEIDQPRNLAKSVTVE